MADIQGTVNGETLDGTSDSDIINAGDGNDIVNGLGGDDTLNGEGGNDTLDGGQGNDLLVGGAGDDIYIINDADGIIENAGEGTDEIRTSIDWGLIDHVENITATGSGNVFLGGNSGANVITGNSGDNYIVGEGDNDTIDGGAGRDVASFQLPEGLAGTVRQVAGAGAEEGMILIQLVNGEDVQTWARVSVSAVGSATVEGVGIGAFLGTDTVSNVEELHFFVANTPDFANQFTNVQLATIHSGQFVSGGEAGDTIDLAAYPGATDANGNGGNDTIIGTAGVNYLMGGAGNDSIDGGAGADVAAFHLGQDSTGTITQVAGTGEDQGKILIQVVNGELSETFAKVTVTAQGSAVVEGVGIGAFLGIDTITNIEQLHFTVGNGSEGQFTSVSLAPQQFGDFVAGGEAGETIDLAAFPGALNANGNGGDDTVLGTADANTLSGGNGNDVVSGGDGHDILRGNGGDDVLHGEDGNDILIGGAGNDLLIGGNGIDRISLYNEVHGLTVDLRLDGIAQDFGVMGIDTLSGIEHVYATYWSDNLFGNEAGNWFFAAAGNDTIATFGGDDYVTLGYGDKVVDGGDGNDTVEITDDASEPQSPLRFSMPVRVQLPTPVACACPCRSSDTVMPSAV